MNLTEKIARKMHELNLSPTLGRDNTPWEKLQAWKKVHFLRHAESMIMVLKEVINDNKKD